MATRSREQISAFGDLVEARSPALLRLAYGVVGDYQLAQDLLQEALVKVYVAWPRLRSRSAAEAYARRTIVTTAISWRRRRSFHEPPIEAVPDSVSVLDEGDWFATHDVLWQQVRGLRGRDPYRYRTRRGGRSAPGRRGRGRARRRRRGWRSRSE